MGCAQNLAIVERNEKPLHSIAFSLRSLGIWVEDDKLLSINLGLGK